MVVDGVHCLGLTLGAGTETKSFPVFGFFRIGFDNLKGLQGLLQGLTELAVSPADFQGFLIYGLRFHKQGAADMAQVLAGSACHLISTDTAAALSGFFDFFNIVAGIKAESLVLNIFFVASIAAGGCSAYTADGGS